ncbi:DEAD/DEAH box helicase [Corynebacterium anserum]|nr:DEAD/DEAH box helicase [Corynebacterium anserum]
MEFSHQVHALWPRGGGLHLWVERIQGHGVVTDVRDVEPGGLPDELLHLVQVRPLRVRGRQWLATPRGKLKNLPVPTVSFTPEQSLGVLAALACFVKEQRPQSGGSIPALSPEVVFLVDLYLFVCDVVQSGRVMLRMDRIDNEWFPRWMMSTAGDHLSVLQRFRESVPQVLSRNGAYDVVGQCADDLTHWATVRILRDKLGARDSIVGGGEIETPFVHSLVEGEPARRVTADTVSALNRWRTSAEDEASRVVLILSAPSDATVASPGTGKQTTSLPHEVGGTTDPDKVAIKVDAGEVDINDVRWRLDLAIGVNDGPVQPVIATEATDAQRTRLRRALDRICTAWPAFKARMQPVVHWLDEGVWYPPAEIVTANPSRDRVVSLGLTADDVHALLSSGIGKLSAAGVQVMVPRGWARVSPRVSVVANPVGTGAGSGKLGLDQLVDFQWDVSVDGEPVDGAIRREMMNSASGIVAVNGHFVYLDQAVLARTRGWFRQLAQANTQDKTQAEERAEDYLDTGAARITLREVLEAEALASAEQDSNGDHEFRIEAGGWLDRLFSTEPIDPPEPVAVPETVLTELRDHQRRGLNWLVWMYRHRLGAILADDMGLGKTLQVLALLAWEKDQVRDENQGLGPTLVVAPTSVVEAWKQETKRHVPHLRVLVDHGSARVADSQFVDVAGASDVVVTSYGTLSRNPERYGKLTWHRIVADEAQNIKNPATKQSSVVRSLKADHRIALTGTPVENRLSDLYAIMDFANPGILGSAAAFHNRLAIPVERYGDEAARERLKRLVQPFILRRLKTDATVGLHLPEKKDIVELIPLTHEQAALYEAFIKNMEEQLRAKQQSRRGMILGALVKIKQICNHPAHYAGDGSGLMRNGKHRSHKVRRLLEIVDAARADGRKVLIFTQFPSFGRMLIPELERRYAVNVPMLHGGSGRTARNAMVTQFQSPDGPPIMVLSVRAGGTGITLTEASVVVHIDRWWNPAVEDQATDRAYRIGQDKDVTVYKLVAKGTLDERIHDIISGKRELAGAVIGSGEGWIANLDDDDLKELWRLKTASEEALVGEAITTIGEQS